MSSFAKGNPFSLFFGDPFFSDPLISFFFLFLSPAKVGSLEMQPGAKLQAYLGVSILQPYACEKGIQGSLRQERGEGLAWRGGRKRWCKGISAKSPKIQLPNQEGWRRSPARGGYREAPGSHLPFDALRASTSLVSDSSACHSLTSFFTSGRAGGSGGPP